VTAKSSDQPEEGGDRGIPDQPAEAGSDLAEGIDQTTSLQIVPSSGNNEPGLDSSQGPTLVHNNTELSTPAVNTSDALSNEMRQLFNANEDNPVDPTITIPGKSPTHPGEQLELRVVIEPKTPQQSPEQVAQSTKGNDQIDRALGADPYIPGRQIESLLRVFKQFACNIPRG
jgi:hypothetical protein